MLPSNYRPSALMAGMATVSAMNTMMTGWEREDARRDDTTMTIELAKTEWSDRYENAQWDVDPGMPVMCSLKNVSPYRVHRRRQKNKAARRARRRNRR